MAWLNELRNRWELASETFAWEFHHMFRSNEIKNCTVWELTWSARELMRDVSERRARIFSTITNLIWSAPMVFWLQSTATLLWQLTRNNKAKETIFSSGSLSSVTDRLVTRSVSAPHLQQPGCEQTVQCIEDLHRFRKWDETLRNLHRTSRARHEHRECPVSIVEQIFTFVAGTPDQAVREFWHIWDLLCCLHCTVLYPGVPYCILRIICVPKDPPLSHLVHWLPIIPYIYSTPFSAGVVRVIPCRGPHSLETRKISAAGDSSHE